MHFVSTEADKGGLGRGELSFHSDCAFLPHPRIVLSLHAIDVVDALSSTKWISARNGWNAMAPELQLQLKDTLALHVMLSEFTVRLLTKPIPDWLPHHWHDTLLTHLHPGARPPYIIAIQKARTDGFAPSDANRV